MGYQIDIDLPAEVKSNIDAIKSGIEKLLQPETFNTELDKLFAIKDGDKSIRIGVIADAMNCDYQTLLRRTKDKSIITYNDGKYKAIARKDLGLIITK